MRITVWVVILAALLAGIIWLAGPWFGLGTGGLYGATRAGKAIHRKLARKEITE